MHMYGCIACVCVCCCVQMAASSREVQDAIKRLESRVAALSGNSPQVNAAEEAAKRYVAVCVWEGKELVGLGLGGW
jgi:hypothetical protein